MQLGMKSGSHRRPFFISARLALLCISMSSGACAPLLRGMFAPRRLSRALSSNAGGPSLDGQVCWVIGGAGLIGSGIARGLLRAGATVIVNSRHEQRLAALSNELGHPEKLVTLHGSMMPDGAEDTIEAAMGLSDGHLDHVVVHSAVRWWGRVGEMDETGTLSAMNSGAGSRRGWLLNLSHDAFATQAVQLPLMQFAAAKRLLPRLAEVPNASYTFVTGGAGEEARSAIGQINAQAVWGLAAAVRTEMRDSPLKVNEVRVGLRFNRKLEERLAEPREQPLSHEVGRICAGIAAAPAEEAPGELLPLFSQQELQDLRARFPASNKGYSVYYSPEDVF